MPGAMASDAAASAALHASKPAVTLPAADACAGSAEDAAVDVDGSRGSGAGAGERSGEDGEGRTTAHLPAQGSSRAPIIGTASRQVNARFL